MYICNDLLRREEEDLKRSCNKSALRQGGIKLRHVTYLMLWSMCKGLEKSQVQ